MSEPPRPPDGDAQDPRADDSGGMPGEQWEGGVVWEAECEVLDAPLPVLAEVRQLEPAARLPTAVALAQTAAVAATGFVAGVATAAVLGRRRQRRLGRPAASASASAPAPAGRLEVVSSRTYLVDVHVLERRG